MLPASGFRTQRAGGIAEQTVPGRRVSGSSWGWREDGGYTYYLNPVSDGTRGQMLTGWHQIDSIWYYFNKLTGGPQGSLVKNATTPDGYKVGADGAWLQ